MSANNIRLAENLIKSGFSKEEALAFLNSLSKILIDDLKANGQTKITSIGTWALHASTGRSKQGLEKKIYFTPFRRLKESLNPRKKS